MEKQYTRENLETKIRNSKRLLKSSLCTYIAGFALMGFGVVNASRSLSNIQKPEAYKNFINAQTTLTLLETEKEKSLDRKLDFPYETEKTDDLVNAIYDKKKNIVDLTDNAIINVKEDIVKMEENPEIKSYKSETEKVAENANRIIYGGLLIYTLGIIGLIVYNSKRDKYRNKLRDLDTKVEGR